MKNFMKTALLTAVALVAFSGLASANTISGSCSPGGVAQGYTFAGNPAAASLTFNCLGFSNLAAAQAVNITGATLTAIHVLQLADYSDSSLPQVTNSVTFNFNITTQAWDVNPTNYVVTGVGSSGAATVQTSNATALFNANFVDSFTATRTQGQATNGTANVVVSYDFNPPTGGVPEPMTMSLMGAGLLALGIAGRRMRRS